jgi:hypothetical protein
MTVAHKSDCEHRWVLKGESVVCSECHDRRSPRIRLNQRSAELLTDAINNEIRRIWTERDGAIAANESTNPYNRDIHVLRTTLHQVQDTMRDFGW